MKNATHTKDVNATGVHESHLAKKNDLKSGKSGLLRFSISLMLSLFVVYTLFQVQTTEAGTDTAHIEEDLLQDDMTYVPVFKEEVEVVKEPEPEPEIKPQTITDKLTPVDDDTEIKKQVLETETKPKKVTTPVFNTGDVEVEDDDEPIEEVPFAFIEDSPIYPGCEKFKSKVKRKKCMSEKIQKHINKRFDKDLAQELDLDNGVKRINVLFIIDEQGNVTGIRSRGPHPKLEKEAERVIKLLPKMEPGKQREKNVKVKYTLPIVFKVN